MLRSIVAICCLGIASLPATAQDWQPITEALIVAEKPGFGKLCGVVVDHANGDLIINLSDKGFYRSTDQGKSWQKLGTPFKGRTETPGCLMLDPFGGKRLVAALVYGSPILVSPDRGATLNPLDKKSTHVDWCAADWTDADMKFILTLKHEAADLMLISRDSGKSFDEVGKGYGPAWIFNNQTAVVAQAKSKANQKPGLLRTTDQCKTFMPCGDYHAKALPRWHGKKLYWLVEGALISTADEGKSWTKITDVNGGRFGPIFGKSADHLFVLTQAGILESTNAGKTWSNIIPVAKGMKSVAPLSWMEYDPVNDILYVMMMGSELYQWKRKSSARIFKTPQECFDAATATLKKGDMAGFFECLTKESRELLPAMSVISEWFHIDDVARTGSDEQKAQARAVEAIFAKHGLKKEFLEKLQKEMLIIADDNPQPEERQKAAQALLKPVRDRAGLFADIVKATKMKLPFANAKLDKVEITDKNATGEMAVPGDRPRPISFRMEDQGWRMELFPPR